VIGAIVLNPALTVAKGKSVAERHEAAQGGMANVLQTFRAESVSWGCNRKADGLVPIDNAVAALAAAWPTLPPVWATVDPLVENVLKACTNWLDGRKVFGHRVTGWRTPAIKKLYWQAAWAYNFKQYSVAAHAAVLTNNGPGAITPMNFGALPMGVVNPFDFPGCGYTVEAAQLGATPPGAAVIPQGNVLRGDSRGPLNIEQANGFQGRNILTPGTFAPWFCGNAGDDVISVTIDQRLPINAAKAGAKRTGGNRPQQVDLPLWISTAAGGLANLIGFVYEVQTGGGANACRLTSEPTGKEYIFLALPGAIIVNWWAVHRNGTTYGPFAFPAPAVDPQPGAAWSATGVLAP
jgi:hypothetical protein